MEIRQIDVTVRELIEGYSEKPESGEVVAYGGRLDVRPKYQREFVYGQKDAEAVVDTVLKGFPLNTMYWCERPDGMYEVMDGQQRTISICRFATNPAYSVNIPAVGGGFNAVNFPNLYDDVKKSFLDYKLMVFLCKGKDSEKNEWFQTINIAGKKLTNQEIRNAIYASAWLTDAKSLFSRTGCVVERKYGGFLSGRRERQEHLETAFRWIADKDGITGKDAVEGYMRLHSQDADAAYLLHYFESVFQWVFTIFGKEHKKNMRGVEWGLLYNRHKDDCLDPAKIQEEIDDILANPEVQRAQGAFEYVLEREEKALNLREFSEADKRSMFEIQEHKCKLCGKLCDSVADMHADHIEPWHRGGRTNLDNGRMLCIDCNLKKGGKSPAR